MLFQCRSFFFTDPFRNPLSDKRKRFSVARTGQTRETDNKVFKIRLMRSERLDLLKHGRTESAAFYARMFFYRCKHFGNTRASEPCFAAVPFFQRLAEFFHF